MAPPSQVVVPGDVGGAAARAAAGRPALRCRPWNRAGSVRQRSPVPCGGS